MDRPLLLLVLAILAFGLAFNLHLSLGVMRRLRKERDTPALPVPAVGEPASRIAARRLGSRRGEDLLPPGQACALVFLTSKCDKCRARVPQVAALLSPAAHAGLTLRVVSVEPAFRLRRFLAGTPLLDAVWQARLDDYKTLNPRLAAPAYLFVNHEGVIEAAGLIGDENWLGLTEQLTEQPTEQLTAQPGQAGDFAGGPVPAAA
jgi:hypothetical protein